MRQSALNPGVRRKVVSTCKLCRLPIGSDQPRRWSTSPLGLVHEVCPR